GVEARSYLARSRGPGGVRRARPRRAVMAVTGQGSSGADRSSDPATVVSDDVIVRPGPSQGRPLKAREARARATVWAQRSLIWNFAQRDLKSRFKGTAFGWAWSLMVPMA